MSTEAPCVVSRSGFVSWESYWMLKMSSHSVVIISVGRDEQMKDKGNETFSYASHKSQSYANRLGPVNMPSGSHDLERAQGHHSSLTCRSAASLGLPHPTQKAPHRTCSTPPMGEGVACQCIAGGTKAAPYALGAWYRFITMWRELGKDGGNVAGSWGVEEKEHEVKTSFIIVLLLICIPFSRNLS